MTTYMVGYLDEALNNIGYEKEAYHINGIISVEICLSQKINTCGENMH